MAMIVGREASNEYLKEIDKSIKNKFRWSWMERNVTITYRSQKGDIETSSFLLGKFIRKVDMPGVALCITCDTLINYGSNGAKALDDHCSKSLKHAEKMSIKLINTSLESFNRSLESFMQSSRPSSYRKYDPDTLTRAYLAVVNDNIGVKTAARMYCVPESTLRDRVLGRIKPETLKSGVNPMLSLEEEGRLVDHLLYMGSVGYGFSRTEVTSLATDYAIQLGKRDKTQVLSLHWFYGFLKRWPKLKLNNPHSPEVYRAKSISKEIISKHFTELRSVMVKYDLMDKPQFIYNVDEKGLIENHTPTKVVSSGNSHSVAVTTSQLLSTKLIGCGNAIGQQLPPYFILKGKRMRSDAFYGCTPGTSGTMSDSGWSNGDIFASYLNDHFLKYAQRTDPMQPLLLLYDGHRSHVSLPIIDLAKSMNIVLMVLPADTSHVLQPLNVGCFGPFERIYNGFKQTYLCENVTSSINRNALCEIACKAYTVSLTPYNLISAFKKCGVYPFNEHIPTDTVFKLATAFETSHDGNFGTDQMKEMSIFTGKEDALCKIKSAPTIKKKVLSSVVGGKAFIEDTTVSKIQKHQKKNPSRKRKQPPVRCISGKSTAFARKSKGALFPVRCISDKSTASAQKSNDARFSPTPGTSGVSRQPQQVMESDQVSNSDKDYDSDDEVCWVCKLSTSPHSYIVE